MSRQKEENEEKVSLMLMKYILETTTKTTSIHCSLSINKEITVKQGSNKSTFENSTYLLIAFILRLLSFSAVILRF
jgi:hypothetical protein